MRRLLALAALAVLLVGCSDSVPGGKKVTTPTPETVIGTLPTTTTTPTLVGDPAAGKAIFVSTCAACHTFTPAGTKGTIGPNLDNLPAYAAKANEGTLTQFVQTSITDPGAYIAPGYQNVMPPTYAQSLKPQQIADLVALLTKTS